MSHGGDDSSRWMVSYSDFMTLLMVLFLILYSMSQLDIQKYKQLAEGLNVAFTYGNKTGVINPQIDIGSGVEEDKEPAPIMIPGIPNAPPTSQEVAGQLTSLLASQSIGGMVSVQNNVEGVLISVSESLLFKPGTSELQPQAFPVLETVANMLKGLDNEVRIIGHTDTSEPDNEKYRTNWELSLARSMTIVYYFIDAGIPPDQIIAAGRGEYKPLFPNDTDRHRDLNSRAEIIVIYPQEDEVIHLDVFEQGEPTSEPEAVESEE